MRIIIDTREQTPFAFTDYPAECERGTLETGDYSIYGFEDRIAIERKNGVDELVMCLSSDRERFCKELKRAHSLEYFAVIIEGRLEDIMAGRYRSQMASNAVIESIAALSIRYKVPFLFCGGRKQAERLTFSLLSKYLYEIEKRYERATKAGQVQESSKRKTA